MALGGIREFVRPALVGTGGWPLLRSNSAGANYACFIMFRAAFGDECLLMQDRMLLHRLSGVSLVLIPIVS